MTKDQIKAELRRSAIQDRYPYVMVNFRALVYAYEFETFLASRKEDDCRTFFLLVAEAL